VGENHEDQEFENTVINSLAALRPKGWHVNVTLNGKHRQFIVLRTGQVYEEAVTALIEQEASVPNQQ